MDQTSLHPVLQELLNAAVSEMDDLALRCRDTSEHLKDGRMLAALGTVSGIEGRVRHLMVVIQAAQAWHEKVRHEEAP